MADKRCHYSQSYVLFVEAQSRKFIMTFPTPSLVACYVAWVWPWPRSQCEDTVNARSPVKALTKTDSSTTDGVHQHVIHLRKFQRPSEARFFFSLWRWAGISFHIDTTNNFLAKHCFTLNAACVVVKKVYCKLKQEFSTVSFPKVHW